MGDKIHFLLLGGNAVNANALLRFYVLHCMILPLTACSSSLSISGGFAKMAGFIRIRREPAGPCALNRRIELRDGSAIRHD